MKGATGQIYFGLKFGENFQVYSSLFKIIQVYSSVFKIIQWSVNCCVKFQNILKGKYFNKYVI